MNLRPSPAVTRARPARADEMAESDETLIACDIAFVGHVCRDEVVAFEGPPRVAPGSAVLCGALAAARAGARVAVVTRMSPDDAGILLPMRDLGIVVHAIPTKATTFMRVVHPSANVDEREMYQLENAGRFMPGDVPDLDARVVHLAGITDQEFDLDLIRDLKGRGYRLSADMQSFVRQVKPRTRQIDFRDVPEKVDIAKLLDVVKLDVVEAQVLTGSDDLEAAALMFERWGCPEVVITRSDGVLARANGVTSWQPFTNASDRGRTGRGDTACAAYLTRRLDHDPAESLRFAAALTSLKLEKPGPFGGTLADVLARMHAGAEIPRPAASMAHGGATPSDATGAR